MSMGTQARTPSKVWQFLGLAGTVFYSVVMYLAYQKLAAPHKLHFGFDILLSPGLPVIFLCIVFGVFRNGGRFAFTLLIIATFFALLYTSEELRGLSQSISMMLMLVGAPIALFRSARDYWVARR